MAGRRVTDEDILKMNIIYYGCHNKAETARQVGFSASTVSKYLIPNFKPQTDNNFSWDKTNEDIKFNPDIFQIKYWDDLIYLSQEEWKEIEILRKEVLI